MNIAMKEITEQAEQAEQAEQLSTKHRRPYARSILIGLAIQVVIVDAMFAAYAIKGAHWAIPAATMNVWIGAGAIQVIGVVFCVTRLFPLGRSQQSVSG
jgi:nitrogen fixation/metabolism regulation signal transduction histidine kinase